MKEQTRKDIEAAINCNSEENVADTPDFLLAEFLADCGDAWNKATLARDKWFGRPCGDGAAILTPAPVPMEDGTVTQAEVDRAVKPLQATVHRLLVGLSAAGTTHEMLVEQLAAYAHETWSGWMRYLFTNGGRMVQEADGRFGFYIDADHCTRWLRQAETPYAALPEEEKGSDRKEAEHILNIVLPKLGGGQ